MNRADTSHQSIPLDALASVVGGIDFGQILQYALPFVEALMSMGNRYGGNYGYTGNGYARNGYAGNGYTGNGYAGNGYASNGYGYA